MTSFLRLKNAEKENKTLKNLPARHHRGVLRTATEFNCRVRKAPLINGRPLDSESAGGASRIMCEAHSARSAAETETLATEYLEARNKIESESAQRTILVG